MSFSVIGDSTFFHTGINSLIEVLYNGSRTVNVILDNRITGYDGAIRRTRARAAMPTCPTLMQLRLSRWCARWVPSMFIPLTPMT